jgi:hypothetical protein
MNQKDALVQVYKIFQGFVALQINLSRSTSAVAQVLDRHIPNWQAEYAAAQAIVRTPDTLLQFQAEINEVLLSLGAKSS